jgi:stage II sporulation protein D
MRIRAITALVACLFLFVPASAGAVTWTAKGHGFGHGGGMSQYGAYGYAKHGTGFRSIVKHYYRNTVIGKAASRAIRVLLIAGTSKVTFTGATSACGHNLKPENTFMAVRSGSSVILERRSGSRVANCGAKMRASGNGHLKVFGKATYRGALEARLASGSGLNAINVVKLDSYVKGVVPNEMPASWPSAALRAQAVAARSYVLATRSGGVTDVYDDTRDQVYGGRSSETSKTNKAVTDTGLLVVRHNGNVATTFFFSSSGGRTENIEYAMPGATPKPYLVSVRDPYDGAAPLHSWTRTFSDARMQSALGDLVPGRLQAIEVTKTGVSPRIVRARLVGSSGNNTVSGPTIRSRLGLPSTWVRFSK